MKKETLEERDRRVRKELCLCCQDCKHYKKHYVRGSVHGFFVPTRQGHCMNIDIEIRPGVGANDAACDDFELKDSTLKSMKEEFF